MNSRKKQYSKEIIKKAVILRCRGKSFSKIASILKIDSVNVKKIISPYITETFDYKYNSNYKYGKVLEDRIIKAYTSLGIGTTKLSRYYNIPDISINCMLKRRGVEIRKSNEYRKYSLDIDYFKTINSCDKAYWLGLLSADGCNSRDRTIKLGLNNQDCDTLVKLKQCINYSGPIKNIREDMVELQINSREFTNNIMKYGIVTNKTFKINLPKIPNNLYRDFIRGYFDGDGCIYINKKTNRATFTIAGNYDMVKSIQKILIQELHLKNNKISKQKTIYQFSYSAYKDIIKIYEYLYKDAQLYMNRKYNKFNEYFYMKSSRIKTP